MSHSWAILDHFWPFWGHFVAFLDEFAESSNFFAAPLGLGDSLLECMPYIWALLNHASLKLAAAEYIKTHFLKRKELQTELTNGTNCVNHHVGVKD